MLFSVRNRIWVLSALVVMAVAGSLVVWKTRHDLLRFFERSRLPEATHYQYGVPSGADTLPAEINLAVPFTPQAPHANWEDPYGDFCEEASVLMALSYFTGDDIPSADIVDQKLLAIQEFEQQRFGYSKDTTAEETAVIIREYFEYPYVQVVENPTVLEIKQAVASGKLVVVPAAGRLLGNPYFQQPGPLYHMIVVKGYTASGQFIVNDPGTRRGADFLYDESVVMNAMHDWRPDGQIEMGRKVILIVGQDT